MKMLWLCSVVKVSKWEKQRTGKNKQGKRSTFQSLLAVIAAWTTFVTARQTNDKNNAKQVE